MIADILDPRRIPASWRLPAVGYVVLEAALAALAFSGEQAHPRVEVAAFVLGLPAMVVALPGVYVVGALAWDLRDQLAGHPMWPVTVTFTVLFALTAVANVTLARLVWSAWVRSPAPDPDELARSQVSPPLR